MEAVIFVGVQGSGKSTFYRERFFETHVRINLDQLKTRHREGVLMAACLQTGLPFVIDNTNITATSRAPYIEVARRTGFKVIGYFFEARLKDALRRNALRSGTAAIPIPGVVGTYKRLERPTAAEGFDELYVVTRDEADAFVVTAGAA